MKQLYKFAAYLVDPEKRLLLRGDQPVPLTSKAFETLLVLVQNSDRMVSKDDLIRRLWPDSFVEESNLTQNIFLLRKALGETAQDHRYIVTVPGKGYQFAERVRVVSEEEAELVVKSRSRSTVVIEERTSFPDVLAKTSMPRSVNRKRLRIWLLACVAAAAISMAYWLRPPYPPPKVLRIVKLTNSGHLAPNQTLVTDGPRIYYRELFNGQRATRSVSVEGGESAPVEQTSPWMDVEDISPDGTSLLVAKFGNEVQDDKERLTPWIVPVVSGSPRQLTNNKGRDFGWSRNGQTFAIAHDDGLYLMNSGSSQERLLASLPGVPFTPRWSPDGRTIRFNLAYRYKNDIDLWEVGYDGRNLHPVLPKWNSPAREWGGNWTPDGTYFIFHATRAGATDIWAVRESGDIFHRLDHQPVQLTNGPLTFVRPIPSRDGSKIFAVGVQARGELVRFDVKSNALVPFLGGISADHAHFSRDGQWVAYISFPERTLWRCRADGSSKLQLTFPPMTAYSPQWSPDGSRIAFASMASPGEPFKVSLIGRDGGVVETPFPAREIGAGPAWSADGNRLAFSAYDSDDRSGAATPSIRVLDLKTGENRVVPGSAGLHFSGWSPDNRYLAALTVEGHHLMLFSERTGKWHELTREYVDYPEWSSDSRYIYVNTLMYRKPAVLRFRAEDGKAEEVFRSRGPLIGVWGWWSGPAPDGSILLLRDVSIVDLYSLDVRWP